ncbi:MAG: hypothetical protein A3G93_15450 [Nitrospinae bacterium RIFCSPLOWO2_12_FULL_45_22]|nr:MAG: hypothetical protein A3G93_15450 [Nitrospinae bacterium RIFCSPLOWO2_12_FULL_45_22]
MTRIILKNKPLVEAIFELRWEPQKQQADIYIDPNYKLLIGKIHDKVSSEYPFLEQLPTATMPDQIAGYIVQYRFRKGQDKWPLIQIGPGIITLNETDGYEWDDFRSRSSHVLDTIFGVYPDAENNLKINTLILRYIDSIDFDYGKNDIFSFLKEKMKMDVELYERLFENSGVTKLPLGFDLRFSFPSTKPKGAMHLRFVRGKRKDMDSLLWETQVQSVGDDAPKVRDEIVTWIDEAHNLTDDWFFKIIDGELQRRFE